MLAGKLWQKFGEDAIAATEEFLAIPGISGSYKVSAEALEREGAKYRTLNILTY